MSAEEMMLQEEVRNLQYTVGALRDRSALLEERLRQAEDTRDAAQNEATKQTLLKRGLENDIKSVRGYLWLSHGCQRSSLYGDDGEMQCNAPTCRIDFKREPIQELLAKAMDRYGNCVSLGTALAYSKYK